VFIGSIYIKYAHIGLCFIGLIFVYSETAFYIRALSLRDTFLRWLVCLPEPRLYRLGLQVCWWRPVPVVELALSSKLQSVNQSINQSPWPYNHLIHCLLASAGKNLGNKIIEESV